MTVEAASTVAVPPVDEAPLPGGATAVDTALAGWLAAAAEVAKARARAGRVDGQVIGTGHADFTKGNTTYTLRHDGREFQLMDVPGIEGDESRFTQMVGQAVAKAHLVFCVIGTNKKPEAATARRIRSYLGRGSRVCVLVNVKEFADAYEFEEDRDDLQRRPGPAEILRQTEGVLAAALDPACLLPGQCIQGLLGFSALAMDPATRRSTIHPGRAGDQGVHQRKYLAAFGSPQAMRAFSRIDAVAGILAHKSGNFREEIVEANKAKVRELLAATLESLDLARQDHEALMARVDKEMATGKAAIEEALESFSRIARSGREKQVRRCFVDLEARVRDIVAEHLGDEAAAGVALEQAFGSAQEKLAPALQATLAPLLDTLESDLHRAVERLLQDLRRADLGFPQADGSNAANPAARLDAGDLGVELRLGDWGGTLLTVGLAAAQGAWMGTTLGPLGPFIGAALGLVVGAIASAFRLSIGRPARIRKAQARLQACLDERQKEALSGAEDAHRHLMAKIHRQVDDRIGKDLATLHSTLRQPGELVAQQAGAMGRILRQVEEMPHGTIQPVRL